jgi:hypothetical protein
MRTLSARAAVATAVLPLLLLVGAAHVGAAVVDPVTVTGVATCNATTGQYTITWTITNNVTVSVITSASRPQVTEPVPIVIGSAIESGTRTTDLSSSVDPGTIPAAGTATAADGPFDNTTGSVTLTVDWSNSANELSGTASGSVTLAGNCLLATTTVAPTTAAPTTTVAVQPVTVEPSFTG